MQKQSINTIWTCPTCDEPSGNTKYQTLAVIRHKETGQLYALCRSHSLDVPSIYEKTEYGDRCSYDTENLAFCKTGDCDTRCSNAIYKYFDSVGLELCHDCAGSNKFYSDFPQEREQMVNQLQGKYGQCPLKDCNNNLNHEHICNRHPQGPCKEEGCTNEPFNMTSGGHDIRMREREMKRMKNLKIEKDIPQDELKNNAYCLEHSSQTLKDFMKN